MKRILFLILIISSGLFAQVTSLNTPMKLARWTAGNKLNAGTIGDTAQANASLNYNFDRINALWARQHDKDGWFTSLYGDSTANLTIGLAGSQHNKRIVLNDSVYGYYNWQTEGNLLVQGNMFAGGYLTVDSIVTNGDVWFSNNVGIGGSLTVYNNTIFYDTTEVLEAFSVGAAGVTKGHIDFYSGLSNGRIRLTTPDISIGASLKNLYIPSVTDAKTLGTIDGNQNFTDMGYIVPDSVQSDNNYEILYSDTKIAGTSAGDTSANFTTFLNTTNGNETKVRFTYLHRRGNANIKAYYQIRGTDVTSVGVKLNIYTLAGALVTTASNTSTATTTYEEDNCTVSVAGLATNQLYEFRFITYGDQATDIPETKTITIVSTSN